MICNHNWDVCPAWARFSSDSHRRHGNISVMKDIRQAEDERMDQSEESEREKSKRTGTVIRIGRR